MNEVTLASLARNFGWAMEDEDAVHSAEAVLRAGGRVGFCTEYGARGDLLWGATGRVDVVEDIQGLKRESWKAAFLVTHRLVDEDLKHLGFPVAVIRPKNLALGFDSEGGAGGGFPRMRWNGPFLRCFANPAWQRDRWPFWLGRKRTRGRTPWRILPKNSASLSSGLRRSGFEPSPIRRMRAVSNAPRREAFAPRRRRPFWPPGGSPAAIP